MRSKILASTFGALVAIAAVFALTTTLWHDGVDGPLTDAIDFRAFYCAGATLDRGADPYRVEPVRSCERDALATAGFAFAERDVLETPYPPVTIAAIGLLALLPYRLAVELWTTLNIVALCGAMIGVSRLSGLRPIYVALALIASLGFASLYYGQPVPLAVAGLVIAAAGARARDGRAIAVGLVLAAVQPQLALPAWIAAFAFLPASRRALGVATAAIAFVTVACYPRISLQYVTTVLPLHARAELANFDIQYGLSALLFHFGMQAGWAMRLGTLSYLATFAVGVWVARALARRFADDAFLMFAPPAFATLGGTYVHGHQIAMAIPFGLLLFARATGLVNRMQPDITRNGIRSDAASNRTQTDAPRDRMRSIALGAALCALAVPWHILADRPWAPNAAYAHPPAFRIPGATELLDVSYLERQDAVARRDGYTNAFVAWKLPVWFALIALLGIGAGLALAQPRRNAERAGDAVAHPSNDIVSVHTEIA